MLYFFDSSALTKRFHFEQGSPVVNAIFTTCGNHIVTSRLALVELTSAAGIKVRTGAMTPDRADTFLSAVEASANANARQFVSQPVASIDFARAKDLLTRHARQHRLRTLDALQLPSALRRRERSGIDFFVTADRILAQVAALESFETLIPE